MDTFWNLTTPVFATVMVMVYTTPELATSEPVNLMVFLMAPLHLPFDFLMSTLVLV